MHLLVQETFTSIQCCKSNLNYCDKFYCGEIYQYIRQHVRFTNSNSRTPEVQLSAGFVARTSTELQMYFCIKLCIVFTMDAVKIHKLLQGHIERYILYSGSYSWLEN